MRIDYSIKPISKYFLYTDVSFRQSINHFGLVLGNRNFGLSLDERIKHFALGILKFIPVIGAATTLLDTLRQRNTITYLKLNEKDPFKRGEEHGRILKNRIAQVYDPILSMKLCKSIVHRRIARLEKQIPSHLKEEMEGIAKGSGYSYKDVLLIHSFLDVEPGEFGCTSMVAKETSGKFQRIAAANHQLETDFNKESMSRRSAFLEKPISKTVKVSDVLKATGKDSTIQAMVFDTTKREIHLSSSGTYAADKKFKKFGADLLFDSLEIENKESKTKVYRNLDWPWYFLGQETVVLNRAHSNGGNTVSITWPGYIGTLSGMNSQALTLTANQCGFGMNLNGIPNPLLFTDILDTCKNVNEASVQIEKGLHGSSMNIMIADKKNGKSYELEGCGRLSCVGEVT